MAATIIPGASASVTVAGMTQKFFSVSLSTGKELIDVSSFGDAWRQRIGGLKDLSGTLTGYLSRDVAATNPFVDVDNANITITFDTGCSVAFTGVIGQRTVSADVNGAEVATWSFSKTGTTAPTILWDEA